MEGNDTRRRAAVERRWRNLLITLAIIGFTGVLAWYNLPREAYPTDLSLIGKGQPALVLTFDKTFGSGRTGMDLMNSIRSQYDGRLKFLVTALTTPEGKAFGQRYNASSGSMLLFAGDGSLVKTLNPPQTVDELRQALKQSFGL
jgi:hypothetical protein